MYPCPPLTASKAERPICKTTPTAHFEWIVLCCAFQLGNAPYGGKGLRTTFSFINMCFVLTALLAISPWKDAKQAKPHFMKASNQVSARSPSLSHAQGLRARRPHASCA